MTEKKIAVATPPVSVAITKALIDSAKNARELFDLPAIKDNWVRTYERTSGQTDGALRYELQKVLALKTISESMQLMKCDNFSIYASMMELGLSRRSLQDGECYLIPYKQKCTFQIGWKGRLGQIAEMHNVTHVTQPQVVYDCDDFVFERGLQTKIHKHIEAYPRPADAKIIFVYMGVYFSHLKEAETYIMDREEVLQIRDKYSQSYKQYMKDRPLADANGKVNKTGSNGPYQVDLEEPMWVSSEAQAWRKTLVKRVYNNMPKMPHHKYLDEHIAKRMAEETGATPEDMQIIDADEDFRNTADTAFEIVEDGSAGEKSQEAVTVPEDTKIAEVAAVTTTKPAAVKPAPAPKQAEPAPQPVKEEAPVVVEPLVVDNPNESF